jgi:probable phosphoglycerate mutase
MSVETLYIVRHGQTEWNVATRMQGHMDSALTAVGRMQADLHGRTLARLGGIEAVIASPLGRARETAELVNGHLSVPIRHEPALMERDCGAWSGLTIAEVAAAYPGEWRARNDDPYYHRPPEGENLVDMEARVAGFLEALLPGPARTLALVTHGVMSRVILKRLLDLTPELAVTVRHPNELFYRVEVAAAGRAESAHFVAGQGPRPGLLHQIDSETIAGPVHGPR